MVTLLYSLIAHVVLYLTISIIIMTGNFKIIDNNKLCKVFSKGQSKVKTEL